MSLETARRDCPLAGLLPPQPLPSNAVAIAAAAAAAATSPPPFPSSHFPQQHARRAADVEVQHAAQLVRNLVRKRAPDDDVPRRPELLVHLVLDHLVT